MSAVITSITFVLLLIVGTRYAPITIRALHKSRPWTEKDVLLLSWGLLWIPATVLTGFRAYRLFTGDFQWMQHGLVADMLFALVSISALLMLIVYVRLR